MTSSVQSSPSQPFPNLGSVITTDDVSQKGTGSYKADYVNWCRVAHLLQDHAPGWHFILLGLVMEVTFGKLLTALPMLSAIFLVLMVNARLTFHRLCRTIKNNRCCLRNITARQVTDTHRSLPC